MKHRIIGVVAAALLGLAAVTVVSSPSYADGANCNRSDICLYWGGNWNGGVHAFVAEQDDYTGLYFYNCSASNCQLNDNAASIISKTIFSTTMLCDNSWLRGDCMYVD